ncbi:MAG: hypothetical protein QM791_09530 [Ferruginibacter sp.]
MLHLLKTLLHRISIIAVFLLSVQVAVSQNFSFNNLLDMTNMPSVKFDAYAIKKNYLPSGITRFADTAFTLYKYSPVVKKNKQTDSVVRRLSKAVFKEECYIVYQTSSYDEYVRIGEEMNTRGFYCNETADSAVLPTLLYQKDDITVNKYFTEIDSLKYYCLKLYRKNFPDPGEISYADDLTAFTSHEYLQYYFGEPNVKKDMYYLSGEDMVRCSVLFSNSPRQVVFIWADEKNRTGIANMLFGGQQRLKSSVESSTAFVGESNWMLKSGVHAGMTLYELRRLNGSNFQFYGGNSANAGAVVPGNRGKINFKKEDIILGCVNCKDNQFYSSAVLDADEAIDDGRILFVLSVILNPSVNEEVVTKLN